MKILISGRPGIGKTTIFMKVIDMLTNNGIKVGGFICPEVRIKGTRVGFDIINISTKVRSQLSRICKDVTSSLRVGKYCVNRHAWRVGCEAIKEALENADVIALDEVGPMELMIPELRECIDLVLTNDNVHALIVIHRKLVDKVVKQVKGEIKLFWVTTANRNKLPEIIFKSITSHIGNY